MSRLEKRRFQGLIITAVCGLVLLVACSTDSPTAPLQVPPPPTDDGGSGVWDITVSASPSRLVAGSPQPSTITVQVRDRVTGFNPPPGTTLALRTNIGEFDFVGSEALTTAAVIDLGNASALYFAAEFGGTATITAEYDGSRGSTDVRISSGEIFITEISPNSGTGAGGTSVNIRGVGFIDPLRVDIGGALATVNSVSSDGTSIRVTTPPYGGDYDQDACDFGNNGILDGERNSPTPVAVKVELAGSGGSETLAAAFTYLPVDTKCYDGGIL
jgi:hypothetical protein